MYASVHTDRSGRVFVSDDHSAAGMASLEATPIVEAVAIPPGTDLVPLARDAVAIGRDGHPRALGKGRLALGALLPPGYLRASFPSYRDEPSVPDLELLPYAAVGANERGELFVSAIPIPVPEGESPRAHSAGTVPVRSHPANALARQLARCARENECVGARAGMGGGELPVPIGAPSAEKPRLPLALRSGYAGAVSERAAFSPEPAEIAEIAIDHLERGGGAVAFGRACDGEPLALVRVLEEAARRVRDRSPSALIRLETSGSDPTALRRALDAGISDVTVRIGSADAPTYELLHGPTAHRWSDVRASIQLVAERGIELTIALLVLPGLTDRAHEIDELAALLGDLPRGRLELRDLGADPVRVHAGLERAAGRGVRALVDRLAEADHFRIGTPDEAAAPVVTA